jgi:hypothetical protein
MKLSTVLALALACCTLTACDDDSAGPLAAKRSKSSGTAVGSWTFDVDGFVDANYPKLMQMAAPGIAKMKEGQKRIDALPPAQREAAEEEVRARLSETELEMRDAVMKGPEAVKEWSKKAMREKLDGQTFELEFGADGSCSVDVSMGGRSTSAQGTWTQKGSDVTVTMTQVDGRAATAKDREPKTMRLVGDRIRMEIVPGAPVMIARRK